MGLGTLASSAKRTIVILRQSWKPSSASLRGCPTWLSATSKWRFVPNFPEGQKRRWDSPDVSTYNVAFRSLDSYCSATLAVVVLLSLGSGELYKYRGNLRERVWHLSVAADALFPSLCVALYVSPCDALSLPPPFSHCLSVSRQFSLSNYSMEANNFENNWSILVAGRSRRS